MPSTDLPSGTPIDGAVALVTGGHRGFGRALVDELLERGAARVYATSRSAQPQRDRRIVPLILDVADDASVAAAAQAAPDVSILVDNAGISLATPVLGAPLSDIRHELETNLFGIIRVARAFAPALAEHPPSSMVNVLSVRIDAPKADPREVARQVADAIIAGDFELLADTRRAPSSHSSPRASPRLTRSSQPHDRVARHRREQRQHLPTGSARPGPPCAAAVSRNPTHSSAY